LKYLEPGTFFAFGPAIAREVVQVRTGDVVTSHPEPGKVAPTAPPPPEQLRQILHELKDLPTQAEEEIRNLEAARHKIAELERHLKHRPAMPKVEKVVERVEVPMFNEQHLQQLEALGSQFDTLKQQFLQSIAAYQQLTQEITTVSPTRQKRPSVATLDNQNTPSRSTASTQDALDTLLSIPAIAAKLRQATSTLDATTASYVPHLLHVLWNAALTPEEIVEGRGTASKRTVGRIKAASVALQQVNFLTDIGNGRLQVNHQEIERLRRLADVFTNHQIERKGPT
jgi:hypothetical protein